MCMYVVYMCGVCMYVCSIYVWCVVSVYVCGVFVWFVWYVWYVCVVCVCGMLYSVYVWCLCMCVWLRRRVFS